jgi:hypothetical protein
MRRLIPLPIVSLLLTCTAMPQNLPAQTAPTSLQSQIDKTRPLLIFYPSPAGSNSDTEDPRLTQQLKLLPPGDESNPELKERQVILYLLPFDMHFDDRLSPRQAAQARRRFHIAPTDFTVILLGKDGDEKFRSSKPVPWEQLRGLIDAMPMRQQEMRDRQAH